ncbi:hypothetical protein FA95DRAFT_1610717 [Auriscalpium vulgare]|uniref:Uncharacterized protein n=1 Tax=Auriscalpium vulgare TaxID=40419 RepID=A0ACB8RCL2_9AGAM|nr:hypothetical protein FA95DRAFT_1610717 [Auriscalpium vulgare]
MLGAVPRRVDVTPRVVTTHHRTHSAPRRHPTSARRHRPVVTAPSSPPRRHYAPPSPPSLPVRHTRASPPRVVATHVVIECHCTTTPAQPAPSPPSVDAVHPPPPPAVHTLRHPPARASYSPSSLLPQSAPVRRPRSGRVLAQRPMRTTANAAHDLLCS